MDPSKMAQIAGTAGIISTTTFWSMNFTIDYLTFPALLLGGVPKASSSSKHSPRFLTPSTDSSQASGPFLNRQWQEVYWRGHRWGPLSAILSGASFMTAAWFSSSKSNQQYLYATAAVAAVSVVPWTILVMVPYNNELHRRGDAQLAAGEKDAEQEAKGDGRDLMVLIRKWLFYNDIRASLALGATLAGVMASLQ
ncbi:hypothetical protein DE146DRAFT_627570 [Phaeosphaeria sp. MPI-PUGE-AT-0046c]|nr:hypothetical protein DE146DRAFT_627570 [Phaeosphaeria sp. MPI-PUGE-AT-0046c]